MRRAAWTRRVAPDLRRDAASAEGGEVTDTSTIIQLERLTTCSGPHPAVRPGRAIRPARVSPTRGRAGAGRGRSVAPRRPRRWRRPPVAACGASGGSRGWARGASARSPSRASRRPGARRAPGGSRPGRRRSGRWGRSASSARSAQACRQCGSCAATAATASRRRSGGRDRAASSAAASSGASGSRTVSGLPEVKWTACSGVTGPCYERVADENGRGSRRRRRVVVGGMSAGAGPGGTVRAVLTPEPPADLVRAPSRAAGPRTRGAGAGRRPAPPHPIVGQHGAAAAETARLTAQLAAVADELEAHVPEVPLPRFIAPDEDGPPKEVPLGGAMPYDVVVGPFNPLALPVVLDFDPPKALGPGRLRRRLRGATGLRARRRAGGDLRHHPDRGQRHRRARPDRPCARPALPAPDADRRGGRLRGVGHRGRPSAGSSARAASCRAGIVTVEADGEFAIFNHDGVHRMASARRRTFDAGDAGRTTAERARRGSSRRTVARLSLEPSATRRTTPSRTGCAPASPRPTPWASSTMRRTCRISKRRGWSTCGPSGIPTTRCAAGDAGRGDGRDSRSWRSAVQYRKPLRFDDEVDVSLGHRCRDRRHVPDRLPARGREARRGRPR